MDWSADCAGPSWKIPRRNLQPWKAKRTKTEGRPDMAQGNGNTKRRRREGEGERLEMIMSASVPRLTFDTKPQTPQAPKTPSRKNAESPHLGLSTCICFWYIHWASSTVKLQTVWLQLLWFTSNFCPKFCRFSPEQSDLYLFCLVLILIKSISIQITVCLDICRGVGWLDHIASLFLAFWGPSIVATLICIPTYRVRQCPFSTPAPAFVKQ